MSKYLEKVQTPTLILDKTKCLKNIQRMNKKAMDKQLIFRPHFKTHQSADVANWFRQQGIHRCTVSSIDMAEYFIQQKWKDITIAFPFNIRETQRINQMEDGVKINLVISEKATAIELVRSLRKSTGIFIKIDTGYHRAGIQPDNYEKIDSILDIIEKSVLMNFKGFLSHSGHTYQARGEEEVVEIHQEALNLLGKLKQKYQIKFPEIIVSIGDTPSCSLANDFNGIDEIRPGNFVFYDVMQFVIGSCQLNDIAVALACPIVEKHVSRNEIIIYGGAVHLSKDMVEYMGKKYYGLLARFINDSWEILDINQYVKSVSQEHGIISMDSETMKTFKIGDLIGIIPIHSCLTANLMKNYLTTGGEYIFNDR